MSCLWLLGGHRLQRVSLVRGSASNDSAAPDLQGYIHCMPYGNVSFVMRVFPLHPGYEMMMCAEASVAPSTASIIERNILVAYTLCSV